MTKMLDVLESFLNYHGYIYLRLDGTTRVEQRQVKIQWNFVFQYYCLFAQIILHCYSACSSMYLLEPQVSLNLLGKLRGNQARRLWSSTYFISYSEHGPSYLQTGGKYNQDLELPGCSFPCPPIFHISSKLKWQLWELNPSCIFWLFLLKIVLPWR